MIVIGYLNRFSDEEFYEFIVDFFEVDTTLEASAKLLKWRNKYLSNFIPTPIAD